MYPHERSLVKKLAGKPFVIIGVNSDRDLNTVKKLTEDGTVTWRSFQNNEGKDGVISQQWQVTGWPTVYLIDAKGVIRYVNPQRSGTKSLDDAIAILLTEMGEEFPADADP